ncbi:MAG: ABC transporter ATP-binding protein, partial [Bacteroidota bacterium]
MQNQWSYLLPFFNAHRWQILLSIFLGGIASLFTLLVPISLGKFFSYLWSYDSFRAQILTVLPDAWTKDLYHYLILFSGLVLLQGLTMYLERWYMARLGERLGLYLREQLFAAQLQTPLSLAEAKGVGRYLLRWSGDLKSIKRLFTHGMLRFARDIMLLVGASSFLIGYFPEILAPMLSVLCLCWLGIMTLRSRLKQATIDQRNRQSGLLSFVSRRLRALATIQALNRDVPEAKRFAKRSQRYYQSAMRYHQLYHLLFSFAKLSVYFLLLALMWWSMVQVQSGKAFSEGDKILSAFLLLISLRSLLGRLLRVPIYWELGMISLHKLQDILNFAEMGERETYVYDKG